eukprot:CAMPEP_0183294164 /NCGR_PEP_ID=MMETSP0160_2-20130417/2599_1 /TAXON_ID=2839 ORGANISM="Odontella Sinensis, Strain Grunow 1884" /NCGR_SAMPLE_ID=MMETSP0160_2 /ASSEMBLY_ACC=CAM_ASM_000250 /LENGTH=315 /DNA_ID=CAMNT_0025455425 /DNA_START=114 /DNA_END=1061 /DNA_ORIENTATION=+
MVKVGNEEGKEKIQVVSSSRRQIKKKSKDKPKRPLSAYNFFFKEEREKIQKFVEADENGEDVGNKPDSDDYIDPDQMARLKKDGGKISFEEIGKVIGSRWKNIKAERLSKYTGLAAQDNERYKKEMQAYNGRQDAKLRNESLRPPANFSLPQPLPPQMSENQFGRVGHNVGPMGFPEGQGPSATSSSGGYPLPGYGPGPSGYMSGGYASYGMGGYTMPMPVPTTYYSDPGSGTGVGSGESQRGFAHSGSVPGVYGGMGNGSYHTGGYGDYTDYGVPQGGFAQGVPEQYSSSTYYQQPYVDESGSNQAWGTQGRHQ